MGRVFEKQGKWWIDYMDAAGRRRRQPTQGSKRHAEAILQAVEVDVERGQHGMSTRGMPPETALERFLEASTTRNTADWVRDQRYRLRPLLDALKPRRLSDITPARIDTYLGQRREAHGLVRARKDLQVIKTFTRWCVRMGHLPADPCARIQRLPPLPKRPIRFLAPREADKLLAVCDEPAIAGNGATVHRTMPLRAMSLVGLYAGLRLGEILSLRWEDVDLKAGLLHVTVREDWKPKDRESRRIPLHPRLREVLEAMGRVGALVFSTTNGTPYDESHVHRALVAAGRRTGLTGINFYLLRHTFASWLVQAGQPIYSVSKLLGHASVTTTEHYYAHLAPETLHDVVAALPA
ncbi:MAG: site-specific integrase [Planctomycetes bacterium]|nr:site-specific integrase [Planctomycetota bacterium]